LIVRDRYGVERVSRLNEHLDALRDLALYLEAEKVSELDLPKWKALLKARKFAEPPSTQITDLFASSPTELVSGSM